MPLPRALSRRNLWALAFPAAVVGGVALAAVPAARKPVVDEQLFVHGGLTIVWHGDTARGCAAKGLCGEHGSAIVHFDGYGALHLVGKRGSVDLFANTATARVRRDDPGAQPAVCVDVVSVSGVSLRIDRVHPGNYVARLDASGISGGRCAGPLAGELSLVHLRARRLHTGALGFDLHGSATAAAGPFSGVLSSTLVLRPDTTEQSSSSESSTSGAGTPTPRPRFRRILVEYARVQYRLTGVAGALQTTFAGRAEPYCLQADSCGTTGGLSISLSPYRSKLVLQSSKVVRRRVSPSRALANFRAGKLSYIAGSALAGPRGVVTELMGRTNGAGCHDTSPLRLLLNVDPFAVSHHRGVVVMDLTTRVEETDPWRTHCPGPSDAEITGRSDAFGAFPFLGFVAQGEIPVGSVGSRGVAVVVRNPGAFSRGSYSGVGSGALRFTLRQIRATAGTRSARVRR
jgi:hypothetical protein